MSDENTTINSAITGRAVYNVVVEDGKTAIVDAVTGRIVYLVDGEIAGGGVKVMTTAERTAITPDAGELIYDTDLGVLFVGDGVTPGGNVVGGGGGGGDYTFSNEFTVTSEDVVSINTISASKITGKVGSAGVADALVNGATVGYAQSAGTAATATTATTASTASGVTQAVKDDIISSAGGSSLDGEIASVDEVMTGITGGTTAVVDVSGLRGALTAGQAVDVTSQPDGVTGDYRGTINVSSSVLHFGFASFPKYAAGLTYLMIADITPVSDITVGPGGSWLDGDRTGKVIAGGTTTRIAMLFDAADDGYFNFGSPHGDVSVSNLREYEVTACTNEAIAYIAALSSPDAFASYYLVKSDMVQPWTYIIDMGTSPSVTVASGLSYKLNATTGTHQLMVDTCPAGYDGRDAIIRIQLGGSGVIQAVAPLQLGGALIPYAVNNCVVRFRDGEAVLLVEDILAGYVVTVNTGTGEGSLPYGLAANGVSYIAFGSQTDGQTVDLSGATTAAEEKHIAGNGYADTILTGGITCTSKTTFANLTMSGVVNSGGTMTLGDVNIPAGGTVSVSGGGLAIEKLTGNGGMIDLGGTHVVMPSNNTAHVSGVTFTSGNISNGTYGGVFELSSKGLVNAVSCTFVGNSGGYGGGAFMIVKEGCTITASGCTFTNNYATYGGCVHLQYDATGSRTTIDLTDCTLVNNTAVGCAGVYMRGKGVSAMISGCTISGNSHTNFAYGPGLFIVSAAEVSISDSVLVGNFTSGNVASDFGVEVGVLHANSGNTLGIGRLVSATASMTFAGSNSLVKLTGTSGTVIISSGAVVDLTGNTNATPVAPGGGVIVDGGPVNSETKIIGSAGSDTQTRIFEDATINGTSISKIGAIYGATITNVPGPGYVFTYTTDGGATSNTAAAGDEAPTDVPGTYGASAGVLSITKNNS